MEFIRPVAAADKKMRALIVGAGGCGRMVLEEIRAKPELNIIPVVFVDDNVDLINKLVENIEVCGPTSEIPSLIDKFLIDTIIIAMPSVADERVSKIINICLGTKKKCYIIPGIFEAKIFYTKNLIPGGKARNINYADLLRRPPAVYNAKDICNFFSGKKIMVTGGCGSIGSELVRQLTQFEIENLVVYDFDEYGMFKLLNKIKDKRIKPIIGNILDSEKLDCIFKKYKPDVIFHAAAYKHVPLMEMNPDEAVKTNVFGTKNLMELSKKYNAERFIFISSDKAVNASNIMGATKRLCELMMKSCKDCKTIFASVRFGNVLASRGSAIPLFEKQIKSGKPITVTHKDMERYFILTSEAVQLVLQAAIFAENNGEIFILDMGKPINILNMVHDLAKINGLSMDEIKIDFTGLRPGEKLKEDLVFANEQLNKTKNERIFSVKSDILNNENFMLKLEELKSTLNYDDSEILWTKIKNLLPEFNGVKNG